MKLLDTNPKQKRLMVIITTCLGLLIVMLLYNSLFGGNNNQERVRQVIGHNDEVLASLETRLESLPNETRHWASSARLTLLTVNEEMLSYHEAAFGSYSSNDRKQAVRSDVVDELNSLPSDSFIAKISNLLSENLDLLESIAKDTTNSARQELAEANAERTKQLIETAGKLK